MRSIVLLWPLDIYYSPSLSLLTQGKMVKDAGYETTIIYSNLLFSDDNMALPEAVREGPEEAFRKIIKEVENAAPDLLFIGSWRKHSPFVDIFVKRFKERNPEVPIVHGGHNPTFIPRKVLSLTPEIDYLLIGEGESSLPRLIDALKEGLPVSKIEGIAWMEGEAFRMTQPPKPAEIDSLPLIDYEEVVGTVPKRFDIRSSCGCIMSCDFCNLYRMWKNPVRYHSTSNVLSQIRHLDRLYGHSYVHFIDEMFLNKIDRAKTLARRIHSEFPALRWGGMVRNEFVSDGTMKTLVESGLNNVAVGIESENEKVLRFLNKTPDPISYIAKIPKTLDILKRRLETLEVGLITATPVENERDIIDLIDFMKTIKKDKGDLSTLKLAIGRLIIYPGTPLWERVESGDLELVNLPRKYDSYEEFTEKKYLKDIWPSSRHHYVRNPLFKDMEEYRSLIDLAFQEGK